MSSCSDYMTLSQWFGGVLEVQCESEPKQMGLISLFLFVCFHISRKMKHRLCNKVGGDGLLPKIGHKLVALVHQ